MRARAVKRSRAQGDDGDGGGVWFPALSATGCCVHSNKRRLGAMKSLVARRISLAVLSLSGCSAFAQVRGDEAISPVALNFGEASLSTPALLSLSAATLSFTFQPEASDAATPAEPTDAEPAAEADKSGTDPTKFLRTLGLRNEYQRLTNDKSFNLTMFTHIEPFADGRMNLRLKAPLAYTDAAGDDEFGLGDISLRYNWLAHVDASKGILLGAELIADSASEDVLGRGKWIISPLVTYAMFVSPTMIFAPTYQHNISFAGDDNRRDVNESVIDLYMVFTAEDKKSWWIVDPALVIDWETEQNTPFTIEVEYGRNIGTLFGGALNAYIRPGIGIGQDRPYDWNIEVGFTVVGF
ncbi:hypothetical protein LBMAG48_22990 [Phycisphaerae bacterium]|nr:hypothetical protein LBMAG48_22990 [Phycisphaerae bacterium]